MKKYFPLLSIIMLCLAGFAHAQTLPQGIKTYLDRNYKGWKLSPTTKACTGEFANKGFVSGDFNGDGKTDYAVKFTKGKKGYILAFVKGPTSFKAFVLHDTDAEDVNGSSLGIWKKGEKFDNEGKSFRLKYDAPSDYQCESDVGGIHYFRNGKFVAY